MQLRAVDHGQVGLRRHGDAQLDRLAERPPQQLGIAGDLTPDVGRLRIERLASGEGEQLGGELGAVLRRALGLAGELPVVGVGEHRPEQLEIGDDRGQDVVEVVRDAAGQLADRLHLLRLAQFLLHPLPAGQVADEAGEYPLPVRHRLADRQLDRKILPSLETAWTSATVADDPRLARPHVVGHVGVVLDPIGLWHEHPDVAADHLAGRIAEQRRGAALNDVMQPCSSATIIASGTVARIEVRWASRSASSACARFMPVMSWLFCSTATVSPDAERRVTHRLWIASRDPFFARWSSSPARRRARRASRRFGARHGIAGVEQVVDALADRFRPRIAVDALAAGGPVEDPAVDVMDDDDGGVENVRERGEFGAHGRCPGQGIVRIFNVRMALAR